MKNLLLYSFILFFAPNITAQVILKDIEPGEESSTGAYPVFDYNNKLMAFSVNSGFGLDLWKTDGTAAGTVMLNEDPPSEILIASDKVYYYTTSELFVSNGTPGNKTKLYSTNEDPFYLHQLGNKVLLVDNYYDSIFIITTDGTTQGTARTAKVNAYVQDFTATTFDNKMIMTDASFSLNNFNAFISDGTASGTMYVTDFVKTLGINMEVKHAFGAGDALVVSNGSNTKVYANGKTGDALTSGVVKGVGTVGDWLVLHGEYGFSVYNKKDKSTYEISVSEDSFTPFATSDSSFYFVDFEKYVHEYNVITEKDRKISSVKVGLINFRQFIKINNGWIYYSRVENSTYEIRRIKMSTLQDESLDLIYPSGGLIPDMALAFVGNKIIYNKYTNANGWEWWVKEGTLNTKLNGGKLTATVWPSLVTDRIYFSAENSQINNAMITNASGKLIQQQVIKRGQDHISTEQLNPGIYYVTLVNEKGESGTYKFVTNK